jgi:hypothetical protein
VQVLERLSDDPVSYVWVAAPIETHRKVTPDDERHAVRAASMRCCRLTAIAPNVTRMDYACTLDLKGAFPRAITNNLAIPELMRHGPTPQPHEGLGQHFAVARLLPAMGPGSPPCPFCTGLASSQLQQDHTPTSAPGLGSPHPYLHRDCGLCRPPAPIVRCSSAVMSASAAV